MKISKKVRAEAIKALMTCAASWQRNMFNGKFVSDVISVRSKAYDLAMSAMWMVDNFDDADEHLHAAASLLDAGWEP